MGGQKEGTLELRNDILCTSCAGHFRKSLLARWIWHGDMDVNRINGYSYVMLNKDGLVAEFCMEDNCEDESP